MTPPRFGGERGATQWPGLHATVGIAVACLFLLPVHGVCVPPDATLRGLEADLGNGKYQVRARAARILGYIGDGRHGRLLANMALHDRAREPRRVAAMALGQMQLTEFSSSLTVRLLQLMDAPPATSASAADARNVAMVTVLRALRVLGAETSASDIRRCLGSADESVRQEARVTLASFGDLSPSAPLAASVDAVRVLGWSGAWLPAAVLVQATRSAEDADLATALLTAAVRLDVPDVDEVLMAGIRHPLSRVRAHAARLIGRFQCARLQPRLADLASRQGNTEALLAFTLLDPAAAEKSAIEAACSDDPAVRRAAGRCIAMMPGEPALQVLRALARDGDSRCAVMSLVALGLRDPDPGTLLQAAESPVPEVRRAGIEALAWRGGLTGRAALTAALLAPPNSTDDGGRALWESGAEGLALAGSEDVTEQLIEMLGSAHESLAPRVLLTLGMVGGPDATDAILAHANCKPGDAVDLTHALALGRHGGQARVRDALRDTLFGEDPESQRIAALALLLADPIRGLETARALAPAAGVAVAVNAALRAALLAGFLAETAPDADLSAEMRAWCDQVCGDSADHPSRALRCALLCAAGDADGPHELREFLLDPEPDTEARNLACDLLAATRCDAASPALRRYLVSLLSSDGTDWARGSKRSPLLVAAIHALGELRDAESVPLILNSLGESGPVRAAALEALTLICGAGAEGILERGCRDEDPLVRETSAWLLAQRPGEHGAEAIARVLSESDAQARGRIARAAGSQTDALSGVLRGLVADPDRGVALSAVSALASSNSHRHLLAVLWGETLAADLDDCDALARACASLSSAQLAQGRREDALLWARRGYLAAPDPARLLVLASQLDLMGDEAAARNMRSRAAWERAVELLMQGS